MDCIVCSVISVNGRWFADCGATRHGPYVSTDIATRVAVGEARVLHRRGRSVKVSIQDENGKVRPILSRPGIKKGSGIDRLICAVDFSPPIFRRQSLLQKKRPDDFSVRCAGMARTAYLFLVSAAAKARQILRDFFLRRFSVLQHMKFADRSVREPLPDYNRTPSGTIAERLSACH